MTAPPRRRPPKTDTERAEAIRACDRHLRDLKRAHAAAPPDVAQATTSVPKRLYGPAPSSYCTSSAELCAEATR